MSDHNEEELIQYAVQRQYDVAKGFFKSTQRRLAAKRDLEKGKILQCGENYKTVRVEIKDELARLPLLRAECKKWQKVLDSVSYRGCKPSLEN